MVRVHGGVRAQRARDNGAVGVDASLVCGDLAGVYQLLHVGVVAGDADERALVQQVCARVAYVGDSDGVALYVGGRGGAAHARLAQAVECGFDHRGVGGFDGCAQQGGIGGMRSCFGDGLHGDGTRHLARGVAAHAVAHAEERRLDQVGILVMRAHAAHIGARAPHKLRGGAGVIG